MRGVGCSTVARRTDWTNIRNNLYWAVLVRFTLTISRGPFLLGSASSIRMVQKSPLRLCSESWAVTLQHIWLSEHKTPWISFEGTHKFIVIFFISRNIVVDKTTWCGTARSNWTKTPAAATGITSSNLFIFATMSVLKREKKSRKCLILLRVVQFGFYGQHLSFVVHQLYYSAKHWTLIVDRPVEPFSTWTTPHRL